MRRIFRVSTLVVLIELCACGKGGSGTVKTEARTLAAFSRVDMAAPGNVVITVAPDGPPQLTITTDDNLLPLVRTDVADGKVTIWTHEEIRPTAGLAVDIRVPNLDTLKLSGAGTAKAEHIAGKLFELWLAGAGTVDLAGDVTDAQLHMSGAGVVRAEPLHAKNVELNLSGVGEAEIFASDHVDIRLSGAGRVTVGGTPKQIDKHVSGVGTVDVR